LKLDNAHSFDVSEILIFELAFDLPSAPNRARGDMCRSIEPWVKTLTY